MTQRRNTRQRQLVLEAVMGRCDHPTADEVFIEVREKDAKIGRATVYRNLHLLVNEGVLTSVRSEGAERFDRRCDGHAHVVCQSCGRVEDVMLPARDHLDDAVEKATGFEVVSHETMFSGLCPACQAQAQTKPAETA